MSHQSRHQEALAQFKAALESDPLNLIFNTDLGSEYDFSRQYDLGLEQFKKTIDMDANYAPSHSNLSLFYWGMGKYDQWLQEWKKAAELSEDHEDLSVAEGTAQVYAKSGYRAALSRKIELEKQLSQRRYFDPAFIAFDYAELDDKENTFLWLEKGYASKSEAMQLIKVVKPLDRFRSDPRYVDLIKRMGWPQ